MYRVITHPDALEQIEAVPAEALSAYAEAFVVLELAPVNGRLYNKAKPDGLRELVFGARGEGTVTYLLLSGSERFTLFSCSGSVDRGSRQPSASVHSGHDGNHDGCESAPGLST